MSDRSLRSGIRQRLLWLSLLPLLVIIPSILAMAFWWSSHVDYRQLLMKANTDLAVAQEALKNTRNNYLLQLAVSAEAMNLKQQVSDTLSAEQHEHLSDNLEKLRIETGLDYIRLLDQKGCNWLQPSDCRYPKKAVLDEALEGRPSSHMTLFSAEQMQQINPRLKERAALPLIDTEYAHPTQRTSEQRGMMLHVAYPLVGADQKPLAVVVGGLLMNGNITLVDQIKSTVYGEGSLLEGSEGAVTLFLEDVRISTNVPDKQMSGGRALGTRVSKEVKDHVLGQGEVWLDRAFVVSDWYISAYAPILDNNDHRIGMLYSGYLEAPYKQEFYHWLMLLVTFFGVMLATSAWWTITSARSIFQPLEMMVAVIGRIRHGQRTRLTENQITHELHILATEFNQMLQQLESQHDQIQQAAEQLELKVEERTEELKQHIQILQTTREELVAKGKLAAIGQLTAGIAHEINNPTAVILGYLDLMMVELGDAGKPVAAEAKLIVEQVERIRNIINNLLQFSRPDDIGAALVAVDINQLIIDTGPLVKHDLSQHQVEMRLDLHAKRFAMAQRQLLQQVLINLIVNANNAMPEGGKLTIRTRDWKQGGVLIVVADTGCGIAPESIQQIFDPFFSQTQGGTGLGLSVTYSIVQRLKGDIQVRSRLRHGSRFYLWLQSQS